MREIVLKCGILGYPLIAVSILLWGIIIGGIFEFFGERDFKYYIKLIDPLGGISVSLGLLGTVVGFIKAFKSFGGGFNPQELISGIHQAYYTTLIGLILSIIGNIVCYFFEVMRREK